MFLISQRFGVSLQALIAANPHILNPSLIFPGDVLCVPGPPPIPITCSLILMRQIPSTAAGGVTLFHPFVPSGQGVTIIGINLPPPSIFGNFNSYLGLVIVPSVGEFRTDLFPTPEQPPTWAGTFAIPLALVSADSRVEVRLFNTQTGLTGPVILAGSLRNCVPG